MVNPSAFGNWKAVLFIEQDVSYTCRTVLVRVQRARLGIVLHHAPPPCEISVPLLALCVSDQESVFLPEAMLLQCVYDYSGSVILPGRTPRGVPIHSSARRPAGKQQRPPAVASTHPFLVSVIPTGFAVNGRYHMSTFVRHFSDTD